jgi:hypothetical protein
VAHGRVIEILGAGGLERIAEFAAWWSSPDFVTVDEILERFYEEYEDPAESIPFESVEGG